MNKYQITHYWSDSNTFPDVIEQYTLNAKNEDNIVKKIKQQQNKTIRKEIQDLGSWPTNIGIELYYIDYKELTYSEFTKQYPDIDLSDDMQEHYPYIRNYNWEIVEIE